MTEFEVELKKDGRLSINTGDLHGAHHASADEFIKELTRLLGGKVEVKNKKKSLSHSHSAKEHVHADGTRHSH